MESENDLEVPCFWSLAVSKDKLSYWLRSWGERPKQNNCGTIRNQVCFDAPMQRCFFPMYLLSSWFCLFTSARHSLPVAGSGSKSSQKRFCWSFRPADPSISLSLPGMSPILSRISSGLAQLKLKNKLTISCTDIISVTQYHLIPWIRYMSTTDLVILILSLHLSHAPSCVLPRALQHQRQFFQSNDVPRFHMACLCWKCFSTFALRPSKIG